jgi:hypothetical protein
MMIKKYLWASFLVLSISIPAHSAVITADATGFSSDAADFWGVSFDSGSGFVKSVKFDLSPLTALGISFDFDGATAPQLTTPVIGSTSGLAAQDITSDVSANNLHPTSLLFTFASGTFGANDSFRFRADTDGTTLLSSVLGELHAGLLFTVLMEDGSTATDSFIILEQLSIKGSSKSGVSVTTPSSVPVPTTLWLFGSGLLAITARRKKIQVVQL